MTGLNTPRNGDATIPWAACSMPHHHFSEEVCPDIHSKPALAELEAAASHPSTCCLRRDRQPPHCHLLSGATDKASPRPPAPDQAAPAPSAAPHNSFPVPSPASLLAPAFVTLSTFRKYTSLTVLTFRNYLELALLSKMFYLQVHERKTRSSASFFLVYIAITPTYFNTLVSSDFTTVLNTQNQKQCEKM